ncbi:MAG: hypothetical protein SX243_08230 [Acidobacteriota bacterium]|nr:hypothetical protein [Acidobacteriota bacterium]
MNASFSKFGLSLALILGVLASFFPSTVTADSAACDQAQWLDAGEIWSSTGAPDIASEVLAVRIPAAGWLAVQASADFAAAGDSFWLQFLSPDCDDSSLVTASPGTYLGRGVVRVEEPGTLFLRIGAVAPRAAVEGLDLRVSTYLFPAAEELFFQAKDGGPGDGTEVEDPEAQPILYSGAARLSRIIGQDGGPGDGTEVEDPEIQPILGPRDSCLAAAYSTGTFLNLIGQDGDPGDGTEVEDPEAQPLVYSGRQRAGGMQNVIGQDGGPGDGTEVEDPEAQPILLPRPGCQMESYRLAVTVESDRGGWSFDSKDGGPGDGTEVEDPEAQPVRGAGNGLSVQAIPCAAGEPANDLIFCAADFGADQIVEGRFDDASLAVDQDYYSFRVDGLEGIRFDIEASGAFLGTLFDSSGRSLQNWAHGGRTSTLEVILVPGRYYLRLEGADGGAYRIRLTRSDSGI